MRMLIEAWTLGSIDYNAGQVRTGFTILALATNDELVRLMRDISREFQKIQADALRKDFQSIVGNSGEEAQAAVAAAAAAPGAPSAGARPGSGKTPNLDQFTINLTEKAKTGKIDPVLGRDFEIRQVVDILMRRRQNNPILTGEAGVGKTAVVEGFALRVAQGDVPPPLRNVIVRTLDLALLQAGAGIKGEFENRLKGLIEEVKSSPHAHHFVYRRSAHHDWRWRASGTGRRCQPSEAGFGARRVAHHRGHDLVGIQEVFRERSGTGPALPGRKGGGAQWRRSA